MSAEGLMLLGIAWLVVSPIAAAVIGKALREAARQEVHGRRQEPLTELDELDPIR